MTRARGLLSLVLALGAGAAAPAFAQSPSAASPPPPPPPPKGASIGGCVEVIPQGAQRPEVTDTLPDRGRSGYAATLVVKVLHGKGETVLPAGLSLQSTSDVAKQLKTSGWAFPDQDGSAGARLTVSAPDPKKAGKVTTTLELPLVALPDKPGRHVLTLPPLPISVSRASGDVATVCTHEHHITIDDPTAETPDAKPKANPPPRPQREEWTALKRAATWVGVGLLAGAILAYILRRWLTRPRPAPPPPPPRPPWEVALEKLDEVRHAGLLDVGRFGDYFDRVNDALREYLGGRYGFDGLESTTDEMIAELRRSALTGGQLPEIVAFLGECDLVKFANVTPSLEDCRKALETGEKIVRTTMPPLSPARAATVPPPEPPTTPPVAPTAPAAPPPADPGGDA